MPFVCWWNTKAAGYATKPIDRKPIDRDTLLRLVSENAQTEDSMTASTSVAGSFIEDADGYGSSQFSTRQGIAWPT